MVGRVDEGPGPWATGTELGMEATEGPVYFSPSEGCADMDAQLCCYAVAVCLPVHHGEGRMFSVQQTSPGVF